MRKSSKFCIFCGADHRGRVHCGQDWVQQRFVERSLSLAPVLLRLSTEGAKVNPKVLARFAENLDIISWALLLAVGGGFFTVFSRCFRTPSIWTLSPGSQRTFWELSMANSCGCRGLGGAGVASLVGVDIDMC